MRAFSERQPWAHCLLGLKSGRRKRYALRESWPSYVHAGDHLAVHAAASRSPTVQSAIEDVLGRFTWRCGGGVADHRGAALAGDEELAFGALLGRVRVVAVWRVEPLGSFRSRLSLVKGEADDKERIVEFGTMTPHHFADELGWRSPGTAIELDSPERWAEPVPCRGHAQIWTPRYPETGAAIKPGSPVP